MQQNEMIQKTKKFRGDYLHEMTKLEWELDGFLAYYFCNGDINRIIDMRLLILGDDRMSLSAKAQVFQHVATNRFKEWYSSYKSTFGNMGKDLVRIIEDRNVLAHKIIDFKDETGVYNLTGHINKSEDTEIRFVKMKNDIGGIVYTDELIQKLLNTIGNLFEYFSKKNDLIQNGKAILE